MSLTVNIVRIAITSMILAGWTFFIQPNFSILLGGRNPQYTDFFIAYLVLLVAAFIFSNLLIRMLSSGSEANG